MKFLKYYFLVFSIFNLQYNFAAQLPNDIKEEKVDKTQLAYDTAKVLGCLSVASIVGAKAFDENKKLVVERIGMGLGGAAILTALTPNLGIIKDNFLLVIKYIRENSRYALERALKASSKEIAVSGLIINAGCFLASKGLKSKTVERIGWGFGGAGLAILAAPHFYSILKNIGIVKKD